MHTTGHLARIDEALAQSLRRHEERATTCGNILEGVLPRRRGHGRHEEVPHGDAGTFYRTARGGVPHRPLQVHLAQEQVARKGLRARHGERAANTLAGTEDATSNRHQPSAARNLAEPEAALLVRLRGQRIHEGARPDGLQGHRDARCWPRGRVPEHSLDPGPARQEEVDLGREAREDFDAHGPTELTDPNGHERGAGRQVEQQHAALGVRTRVEQVLNLST
jgi:hypothetical protein